MNSCILTNLLLATGINHTFYEEKLFKTKVSIIIKHSIYEQKLQ